jgi:hypothetical protein
VKEAVCGSRLDSRDKPCKRRAVLECGGCELLFTRFFSPMPILRGHAGQYEKAVHFSADPSTIVLL